MATKMMMMVNSKVIVHLPQPDSIMITITMIIMFMTMNRLMMMTMRMMVKTKLIVHLPRPDTKPVLLDCLLISPHQEGYDNDEEVICINY